MSVASITYQGKPAIYNDDTFFVVNTHGNASYGEITVLATDYASLDMANYGALVFTNMDGTTIIMPKIYCVFSRENRRKDINLNPFTYRLLLVDETFMLNQKTISGRYNVQDREASTVGDAAGYISSTLNTGAVWTRAEIISDIAGKAGISVTNNLDAESIEPRNIVLDFVSPLFALQALAEQAGGYFAYDPINDTYALHNYGKTMNAGTQTLLTDNASKIIIDKMGQVKVKDEAAAIPESFDVSFSVYDLALSHKFNTSSNRFYAVNSTSGRPSVYQAGFKKQLYAENLRMKRSLGVYPDSVAMQAEADLRASKEYYKMSANNQLKRDIHYFGFLAFLPNESVTGILLRLSNKTKAMTTTHVRLYDHEPMIPEKKGFAEHIYEGLYVQVNRAGETMRSIFDLNTTLARYGDVAPYLDGDVKLEEGSQTLIEKVPANNSLKITSLNVLQRELIDLVPDPDVTYFADVGANNMGWGAYVYEGAQNQNGFYDNLADAAAWLNALAAASPAVWPIYTVRIFGSLAFTNASKDLAATFNNPTKIVADIDVSGIGAAISCTGALFIHGPATTGNIAAASVNIQDVPLSSPMGTITSTTGEVYLSNATCGDITAATYAFLDQSAAGVIQSGTSITLHGSVSTGVATYTVSASVIDSSVTAISAGSPGSYVTVMGSEVSVSLTEPTPAATKQNVIEGNAYIAVLNLCPTSTIRSKISNNYIVSLVFPAGVTCGSKTITENNIDAITWAAGQFAIDTEFSDNTVGSAFTPSGTLERWSIDSNHFLSDVFLAAFSDMDCGWTDNQFYGNVTFFGVGHTGTFLSNTLNNAAMVLTILAALADPALAIAGLVAGYDSITYAGGAPRNQHAVMAHNWILGGIANVV